MRRYDLDWLRVIVFGLLIFYHIGMLFVPWGFHIKNNVTYQWFVYPMAFLNQWRLPILFVISGMGTYYALSKRSGAQFGWERIKRLGLPLVFGMLVIVPPQVYVERLVNGQIDLSYFTYWPSQAFIGVYPEGNLSWHHLWFLPYLLVFSLILIPLFLIIRKHQDAAFIQWLNAIVSRPWSLYSFIIPLYLVEAFVEPFFPVTHALIDDWFNFTFSLLFFLYGYLLIAVKDQFWQTVESNRKRLLLCAVLGFVAWLGLKISFEDSTLIHFTEAFLKVFNLWSWILTCFGWAAHYLNRSSSMLKYCNEAVYPFYILHQTVMMVVAYFVIDWEMNLFVKFTVLLIGTFGGSWVIYELLIRRWRWVRPFFGLKN
ncbi:acyltransferase family protein [Reichenbachiella ulvae]|uniref:Acyltransferase family protein n=1 Tax=Reichenbachiella ulvae TaxID=2980104 RepID=A0ABT3CP55_9BACT|nr:acyltransferase family protein [Reichenbachiella ulvae]MCV9385495.1 acyltransferase family protein [Reichenbachiella ulvae]